MQVLDNPYFHWGPIRDQGYFYDREKEASEVQWSIGHGQCVSLVGPRKIGKTSLLFHLEALNHDGSSNEGTDYVYVHVDGQAHQKTEPRTFCSEILHRICEALTARDISILSAEEPSEKVELLGLWRAIRSLTHREIRPVILIDEFGAFCENQSFDLAFFNGLRSLATLGAVYVTASKRTLFQLDREKEVLGSPFFNYFRTLHVGLFDADSALKLVREPSTECGIRFDERTVREILHLAGGHPFFLQQACHIAFEIYRERQGQFRERDLEQLRAKSKRELRDQMTSYWRELGSRAKQMLFRVAEGEALQQDSEVTLDDLVRRCLLVKSNGNFQVFSALFKDYVCAQPRPKLPRQERWLDRFQIKEELGRGVMSVVYKAYQPPLERYVAIKRLKPQADVLTKYADRFRREALSIARLDHPNILPVYDFYQEGDQAYIVMKYASNGTLADLLDEAKRPFDPIKAIEIVIHVGRALGYAHRQGVIHRDIKPANIFMGGEGDWPLLGDFGLSLSRGDALAEKEGMTGSADYVAPEQTEDARKADHRSDIYSLGVVVYHLLVGEVPYAEERHGGHRLIKRITQGVPAPRLRNPQISVGVERVILKATTSNPEDRYQTAEDLVEDLEAAFKDDDSRYEYDVFVSYNHQDKDWVRGTLLPELERVDLQVCIDFRDFEIGKPALVNMEEAVTRSRKTLIVLTPSWVRSEWTTFESLLIQTTDPIGHYGRLLPLLLEKCQIPKRIAILTYVDFTGVEDRAFQLQRLITTLTGNSPLPSDRSEQDWQATSPIEPEPKGGDFAEKMGIEGGLAQRKAPPMPGGGSKPQQDFDVSRLLVSALVVVTVFAATVAVLVWAAQQVSVVALAFVLVVAVVFNLVSIVSVLVMNGILRQKWAMDFYNVVIGKVPMLKLSLYPQAESDSAGSEELPRSEAKGSNGG